MESKSVARGLIYGGIASCVAEAATMPIDVIKVRLQMQGADGTKQYKNLLDAVAVTVKKEGIGALYKGIKPAMLRQASYGSLRYGLYAPLRNYMGVAPGTKKEDIPLYKKFIAGGGAGALASFICNPTDLMKVRMQVDGMKGGPPKYTGMGQCMKTIIAEEGFFGLWKGSGPTVGRATLLAAVEMSSYDHIRTFLVGNGLIVPGTVSGVFVSAVASGFLCALTTSPLDVVKSRVMGSRLMSKPGEEMYKGMVDCFVKSVRNEGLFSLWKGFLPNWGRLGPRGVICFVTMESLNNFFD